MTFLAKALQIKWGCTPFFQQILGDQKLGVAESVLLDYLFIQRS
jgi:hypothetical protein